MNHIQCAEIINKSSHALKIYILPDIKYNYIKIKVAFKRNADLNSCPFHDNVVVALQCCGLQRPPKAHGGSHRAALLITLCLHLLSFLALQRVDLAQDKHFAHCSIENQLITNKQNIPRALH